MSNSINDLFTQKQDSFDRAAVFFLLANNLRASSELPNHGEIPGHPWVDANNLIEAMIKINPKQAFEFGVELTLLKPNENVDLEWKYRYLHGNGLTILGAPEIMPFLQNYLQTEESEELESILRGFIVDEEIPEWESEKALTTPEFYSMIAALKVCAYLGDNPKSQTAKSLAKEARVKLKDKRVQKQVGWYLEIEDTKTLAQSLQRFMV